MRHPDFFQLGNPCGIRIRSLSASCAAALFRTARSTIKSWPDWVRQLDIAAGEFLSLQKYHYGARSSEIWDTPPIALCLQEAYLGFPNDDRWNEGATALIHELESQAGAQKKNLQRKVYQKLMDHHFVSDITDTISKRISNMFAPHVVDFTNIINLQSCMDTLSSLNSSSAIKVLKTWVNGWSSSHRYHEAIVYPCLLGCRGGLDDLSHYVKCPHLFALTKFFVPSTSSDPLTRIGLIHPSVEQYKVMCCTFCGYHAVRGAVLRNNSSIDSNLNIPACLLRQHWGLFAEAFMAEAGALMIPY